MQGHCGALATGLVGAAMHHRLLLTAPLLLSACADGQSIGPSLAKRPIENRDMSEPVRAVAAPAPAGAQTASQIAALVERAQAGQRAFAALLPRAEGAASAAGSEGSESWIAAQQLLSALETERAPSTQALSELDALVTATLNGDDQAGVAEIQAADAEIAALVEAQQRDLERLRERVSR